MKDWMGVIIIAWWVLIIALAGIALFCWITVGDRRRRWRRQDLKDVE